MRQLLSYLVIDKFNVTASRHVLRYTPFCYDREIKRIERNRFILLYFPGPPQNLGEINMSSL